MDERSAAGFEPGARAWLEGLGSVRDAVRQALVFRQLTAHLPPPAEATEVLDAGCGQGTQAILLARLGHRVTGIDLSEALLAAAHRARRAERPDVRRRLAFERGDVLDLGEDRRERYDVVCCHGVAMYLPSLPELVNALLAAAAPGGLVSLLTRNRAGIAMRAGMSGQWSAALDGFDATHYTNRLGIERVRADDPADVQATLSAAGARVIAWYGVRLFSDHWDREASVSELDALIAAEEQAGRRDPYRALAALTHTVAAAR
jgi:S-adenosylmethionine-dependent methyltransferase